MRTVIRVSVAVLTIGLSLQLIVGSGSRMASATTGSGALIGLWPDQNNGPNPGDGFTPGQYADPPDLSDIPAMDAWQGKSNSVIQFYDSPDPNSFSTFVPDIWDTYDAVPFMSTTWNNGNDTNAQVAAGSEDSNIDNYISYLKSWLFGTDSNGIPAPAGGRRIFLRWDWEANGTWYNYSPPAEASDCASLLQDEQDFVAAWQHVHDLFTNAGLTSTNVAFVFSVNNADILPAGLQNCSNGASDVTRNIYPGDAYVDWTGIDGYAFCSTPSPDTVFGPMVSELKSISTRPISSDEVAADTAAPQNQVGLPGDCATSATKGQWITNYLSYVQTAGIKMSLWFNANILLDNADADWAVFTKSTSPGNYADCTYNYGALTYTDYCEYQQGLASSYFVGADPSNPQIISDTEFEGTWS